MGREHTFSEFDMNSFMEVVNVNDSIVDFRSGGSSSNPSDCYFSFFPQNFQKHLGKVDEPNSYNLHKNDLVKLKRCIL